MKYSLTFFPQHLYPDSEGAVESFIRKDLKKRMELRLLVQKFLDRVRDSESLDPFFEDETISYLASDDVFEMRIPKTKSGGVVRIYFCKHPDNDKLLVILDAELKKDREPSKVKRAVDRKKIFLNDLRSGGKYGK